MSISNEFEKHGGSYLLSDDAATNYIYQNNPELIGRPDGQFMIPSNQMDELLEMHPSDPRAWEKQLGIEEGSLGEHPVRVDVYSPQEHNLREPTAGLSGSNDMFTGDGQTSGGYDEAVIDQFPNPNIAGNENVGKVEPVNIDLSKKQNAENLHDEMLPDRRQSWPVSKTVEPSDTEEENANITQTPMQKEARNADEIVRNETPTGNEEHEKPPTLSEVAPKTEGNKEQENNRDTLQNVADENNLEKPSNNQDNGIKNDQNLGQ